MALRRLGIVGDSASAGWIWAHDTANGGPGAWWELLAERLANIQGVGPRIGSGFRAVSLNQFFQPAFNATSEWTFPLPTWNQIGASSVDLGLYGYTYYTSNQGDIAYTVPQRWRRTKYIQIYYIDTAGMGDWSINFVDSASRSSGLSAFHADLGYTIAHDLKIHSIFLDLTGWLGSNNLAGIIINGPSGGNSVMPAGVELFSADPRTTDGLIVDNYAQSGRQLDELVNAPSGGINGTGDHMAIFDSVVANADPHTTLASGIKTGTPVSNKPTVGILMEHGNDDKNNNVTQFATDLTTFYNRIHPLCTQAWWNLWELIPPRGDGSGIDITFQAAYRAQLKTTANSLGVPWFDIFDQWSLRGWTSNLKTFQGGVLDIDSNHENAYGHALIAEALYPFVRKVFFPYVDASRPNLLAPQGKTVGGNEVGGIWGDSNVSTGFANGALTILPETTWT